jgi:hypothetical protein
VDNGPRQTRGAAGESNVAVDEGSAPAPKGGVAINREPKTAATHAKGKSTGEHSIPSTSAATVASEQDETARPAAEGAKNGVRSQYPADNKAVAVGRDRDKTGGATEPAAVSDRVSPAPPANGPNTPTVARREKGKGGSATAHAVARAPSRRAPAGETAGMDDPAEVNGQAMGNEGAPATHDDHDQAAVESVGPAMNRDKGRTASQAHKRPSDEDVADHRDAGHTSFADGDADDPEPVRRPGAAEDR